MAFSDQENLVIASGKIVVTAFLSEGKWYIDDRNSLILKSGAVRHLTLSPKKKMIGIINENGRVHIFNRRGHEVFTAQMPRTAKALEVMK